MIYQAFAPKFGYNNPNQEIQSLHDIRQNPQACQAQQARRSHSSEITTPMGAVADTSLGDLSCTCGGGDRGEYHEWHDVASARAAASTAIDRSGDEGQFAILAHHTKHDDLGVSGECRGVFGDENL